MRKRLDVYAASLPQTESEYQKFKAAGAARREARRNAPARPGYTGTVGSVPGQAPAGPAPLRATDKAGKPIISMDGGKSWEYEE